MKIWKEDEGLYKWTTYICLAVFVLYLFTSYARTDDWDDTKPMTGLTAADSRSWQELVVDEQVIDPEVVSIWMTQREESAYLIGICAFFALKVEDADYGWWSEFGIRLIGWPDYYRATQVARKEFESNDIFEQDMAEIASDCDGLRNDIITFKTDGSTSDSLTERRSRTVEQVKNVKVEEDSDLYSELRKLKQLRDDDILTEAEYQELKQKAIREY